MKIFFGQVYRDGVADNQFHEKEVRAIRLAFSGLGYPEEQYGISVVVCQKRHSTRLFYQEGGQYTNVCVGLCVGDGSIVSGEKCEFYLNSNLAVLGTSKPCIRHHLPEGFLSILHLVLI